MTQFQKLQHRWYKKLKNNGFIDIENGLDTTLCLLNTFPNIPEFRESSQNQESDIITEPRLPIFSYSAEYFRKASILDMNWDPRWEKTKRGKLEHIIWSWHAQLGLGPKAIFSKLKEEYPKYIKPGILNSADAIEHILFRWEAVLRCFDFNDIRLEGWEPGNACVQAQRLIPGLKERIDDILKKVIRKRNQI